MVDKFLSVEEARDIPANFISAKEIGLGIEQLKNIILSQMCLYPPASNFSEIVKYKRGCEVRIEELISAVRREEHEKRQGGLNQKLRRIIELTASIESDNAVWGNDTKCGSIEDLVDSAKKILEEK